MLKEGLERPVMGTLSDGDHKPPKTEVKGNKLKEIKGYNCHKVHQNMAVTYLSSLELNNS